MDLPPGFAVSLPGGVVLVECVRCGAAESDPWGQGDLEGWARGHRCPDTAKDAAHPEG